MSTSFNRDRFPAITNTVVGRWAPVLLAPILDSPERLVVGVAAADEHGFHIEQANALTRLRCLFGKSAETAIFAAEVALEELRSALAQEGLAALREQSLVFTGVTLGEVRSGEGASLKQIARTWMSALSSLYDAEPEMVAVEDLANAPMEAPVLGGDRLPILVLEDVSLRQPMLAPFFSEEIRNRRQRRSRPAAIGIDYSSPTLVANFATLAPSTQAQSVDRIKRKLFDLVIRRDEHKGMLLPPTHEMIVYSPGMLELLGNEKQREGLDEAHDLLGEQSRREEITFLPVTFVPAIGDRLVQSMDGYV